MIFSLKMVRSDLECPQISLRLLLHSVHSTCIPVELSWMHTLGYAEGALATLLFLLEGVMQVSGPLQDTRIASLGEPSLGSIQ